MFDLLCTGVLVVEEERKRSGCLLMFPFCRIVSVQRGRRREVALLGEMGQIGQTHEKGGKREKNRER